MDIVVNRPKFKSKYVVPTSKSAALRALVIKYLLGKDIDVKYHDCGDDVTFMVEAIETLKKLEKGELKEAKIWCGESASVYRFLSEIIRAKKLNATLDGKERLLMRMNSGASTSQFESARMMLKACGIEPAPKEFQTKDGAADLSSESFLKLTESVIKDMENLNDGDTYEVEGDWSSAAYWFAASAITKMQVEVSVLNEGSTQPDSAVISFLHRYAEHIQDKADISFDGSNFPDLVPTLAIMFATRPGKTTFTNIANLKFKESDRILSTVNLINAIGGHALAGDSTITIYGIDSLKGEMYKGGVVDAMGDHRIAMVAGISAYICNGPVTILGAECVKKSYPDFFKDLLDENEKAN